MQATLPPLLPSFPGAAKPVPPAPPGEPVTLKPPVPPSASAGETGSAANGIAPASTPTDSVVRRGRRMGPRACVSPVTEAVPPRTAQFALTAVPRPRCGNANPSVHPGPPPPLAHRTPRGATRAPSSALSALIEGEGAQVRPSRLGASRVALYGRCVLSVQQAAGSAAAAAIASRAGRRAFRNRRLTLGRHRTA